MCDLAHSYVWPSSVMGDTWLLHMQHAKQNTPPSAMFFTCDSWLICTCAMTHSCVAHDFFVIVTRDSFVFVTWSKHKSHSPPPCSACVTYGSSRVVTRLSHMSQMTHSHMTPLYAWHEVKITAPRHFLRVWHMVHLYLSHDPVTCCTRLTRM